MNKSLSLLTICRKAGKLEIGMDSVKEVCRNRSACCVVVATDISPKSLKEISFVCKQESVEILNLDASMDEIWGSLGKKAGILAVCDSGFAKKLRVILTPVKNE